MGLWVFAILAVTASASPPGSGYAFEVGEVGYTFENFDIECATPGWEWGVYDYALESVGYPTFEAAMDFFRNEHAQQFGEGGEWSELEQGDTSKSPLQFTDERGWVYLSVSVGNRRKDNTWFVGGYESCTPPGS